jgi:hypothetical protein
MRANLLGAPKFQAAKVEFSAAQCYFGDSRLPHATIHDEVNCNDLGQAARDCHHHPGGVLCGGCLGGLEAHGAAIAIQRGPGD